MSSYVTKKTLGDTEWFRHDRFGMFIHWGLYAMPARHEWIKRREMITEEHYDKYFKYFDPDLYDPKEWARQAKAAGMKYAIITTKHHEGFCMWDSQYTDYKCTNTKCGRDLVGEFVDAFRAEGLRIGFYYSLLDWHHPDFTMDWLHPRFEDTDRAEFDKGRDMKRYAEYMRNQVRELLTNYGDIDIMWFDFSYPNGHPGQGWPDDGKGKDEWESEKLVEMIRSIRPGIIINNRMDIPQDIWTPEQVQATEWVKHPETGELVTWESCQTFSGSWGYNRDEMTWKSPRMLLETLVNTVSCGGNLIMNVGPTSRGYFDHRAEAALKAFADWMKYNSRSIYGCTMAEPEFTEARGCRYTQSEDGTRLYVHLMEYPFKMLVLPGMGDKIDYAQFLHDGSELKIVKARKAEAGDVVTTETDQTSVAAMLEIPVVKPDVLIPVVEIFLKQD